MKPFVALTIILTAFSSFASEEPLKPGDKVLIYSTNHPEKSGTITQLVGDYAAKVDVEAINGVDSVNLGGLLKAEPCVDTICAGHRVVVPAVGLNPSIVGTVIDTYPKNKLLKIRGDGGVGPYHFRFVDEVGTTCKCLGENLCLGSEYEFTKWGKKLKGTVLDIFSNGTVSVEVNSENKPKVYWLDIKEEHKNWKCEPV
jgi:hypothetical protein